MPTRSPAPKHRTADPIELCADIHRLFLAETKETLRPLFDKTRELVSHFLRYPATANQAQAVCDLERKLFSARGANRQAIEERVLETLAHVASACEPDPEMEQEESAETPLSTTSVDLQNATNNERNAIAAILCQLVRDVLHLNIPRDNFNNKRKSHAIEILGTVAKYHDVPELLDICKATISSGKPVLVRAGIEAYQRYLLCRNEEPCEKMAALLDDTFHKTGDRSVAFAALNSQVETGYVTDFEALLRMDEWKSERRR